MPHLPASEALSHVRVIDLTQVRAGPTCCRQLADWGADVVVEATRWRPYAGGDSDRRFVCGHFCSPRCPSGADRATKVRARTMGPKYGSAFARFLTRRNGSMTRVTRINAVAQ